MTIDKTARKYHSPIFDELEASTTPVERMETEVQMAISVRIEELMKAKGWNKTKLAEMTGKKPSEISRWLSGTHNFTVGTLAHIACALGASIEQLMASREAPQAVVYSTIIKASIVNQQIRLQAHDKPKDGFFFPSDTVFQADWKDLIKSSIPHYALPITAAIEPTKAVA